MKTKDLINDARKIVIELNEAHHDIREQLRGLKFPPAALIAEADQRLATIRRKMLAKLGQIADSLPNTD